MNRSISSIRLRLEELLAAHAVENERPSVVTLLPFNARCPVTEEGGLFPRAQRVGRSAIITYKDIQPTDDQIRLLLDELVQP